VPEARDGVPILDGEEGAKVSVQVTADGYFEWKKYQKLTPAVDYRHMLFVEIIILILYNG
jgi:hypothetical protein